MGFTLFDNKTVKDVEATGIGKVSGSEGDNNSKKYKPIDRVFVNRGLIEEILNDIVSEITYLYRCN